MTLPPSRILRWAILLAGLLLLGNTLSGIWPKTNYLHIRLPQAPVRSVQIDIFASDGEPIRSIERFIPSDAPSELTQTLEVPDGNYTISLVYLSRAVRLDDKSHDGDWTRMGVQHQIRLTGADYRFPPPNEE